MSATARQLESMYSLYDAGIEKKSDELDFFNLSPFAIIFTELKSGVILDVNDKFESLYGADSDDVIGHTVSKLSLFETELWQQAFIQEINFKGSADNYNANLILSDGSSVAVALAGTLGKYKNLDILITYIRDVSHRKVQTNPVQPEKETFNTKMVEAKFQQELLEEAAEESNALLKQVAASKKELEDLKIQKDKLASLIAYDLKGPFSAILGFSSMLKNNFHFLDKKTMVNYADQIHKSAESATETLKGLLSWSVSEMKTISYKPSLYSVGDALTALNDLYTPLAKAKGITVDWHIEAGVKSTSDQKMVETVISNLLSNAIKFTNKGDFVKVVIAKNEEGIQVSVSDTGIGMSKRQISNLHQVSNKASNVGTAGELGAGLGVNLCLELIKKHDGELVVTSSEGEGSCFSFNIPDQKI